MKINSLKPALRSKTDYIKGVSSPIPYLVRSTTGDWTEDLPTFIDQRDDGYDTSDCWLFAGVNVISTQCNFLLRTKQFPQSSVDWFTQNGYLDTNGKFAFSDRFLAALATYPDVFGNYNNSNYVRDGGNDQIELPKLVKRVGLLPRKDFDATPDLVFASQEDFNNYYYDSFQITAAMRSKALKALDLISIQYEWLGKEGVMPDVIDMKAGQLQSPLQIGIPIPSVVSNWNNQFIQYDGGTTAEHSIELTSIGQNGFHIRNTYNPCDKTLSTNYFIPMVSLIYVTPILTPPYNPPVEAVPYSQNTWTKVWQAIWKWFNA